MGIKTAPAATKQAKKKRFRSADRKITSEREEHTNPILTRKKKVEVLIRHLADNVAVGGVGGCVPEWNWSRGRNTNEGITICENILCCSFRSPLLLSRLVFVSSATIALKLALKASVGKMVEWGCVS